MRYLPLTLVLAFMMFVSAPPAQAHTITRSQCLTYAKQTDHVRYSFRQCMRRAKAHRAWHVVGSGTAVASWYGPCCYGNSTADGTSFTSSSWGVAHRTYGFNVYCTFTVNGKTARRVRVFDRGPHVDGRTFDLSAAVARALGVSGTPTVRYFCTR